MRLTVPFRRWLHTAPATERAVTAAVIVVVLAVLAWGLGPARPERPADLLGAALAPAADGGSDASSGAAPSDGSAAGEGAAGSPGGVGPALSGPSKGSGGSSPGGGPASGTAAGGRRTASDRGVTADAIKVGFATISLAGANNAGIYPRFRQDASEAVDALVDYANKRGGVLGRRIQPVKVNPVFTDGEDQRRKCVQLTETEGVFAVIDGFSFSFDPATACITAEHKTLLLNGNPGASANIRHGFPYQVSVFKDDNRKMKDLVVGAKAAGFFDPAKGFRKLGLLEDTCFSSSSLYDSPTDGLKAHLSAAGIKGWSEFRGACNPGGQERNATEAVLQFQQDDVSHVLLTGRPPALLQFLRAAKAARYFPKYVVGDHFNLIVNPFIPEWDPEGFDGALGVTQTHIGEGPIGKPLPSLTQTCSKILTDRALPPISAAAPLDIGDDIEILELCENFLLFLQVANAAGTDLTRSTWLAALAGVGDFRAATVDLARFDPQRGKMTGGDTTKLVQWHASCRCWKQVTDFGPAAG